MQASTDHDPSIAPGRTDSSVSGHGFGPVLLEILLILLLFGLFAGQWPPDVNEAHYLAKARHGWDPSWCPDDLFLDSAYSHWLFYVLCGWWNGLLTLVQVAWVGRLVTWTLMAWAWQRLGASLCPRWGFSWVAAAVFLVTNDQMNLAGEWVIGGFESKGLAYVAVLLALAEAVRGCWSRVWPLLGVGTALHVLVGGWAGLALLPVAWFSSRRQSQEHPWRPLPLALGAGLGLIGILPPLLAEAGTDAVLRQQAHLIYVQERIAHHLTFDGFRALNVARFSTLLVALAGLVWVLPPGTRGANRWRRLAGFAAGGLAIAWVGLWLSGLSQLGPGAELWCAQWLRFYWFRLADMAVPLAVAMGLAEVAFRAAPLTDWRSGISRLSLVVLTGWLALVIFQRHLDPRPRADRQSLPSYPDSPQRTRDTHANWKRVCAWIAANTPREARFITPAQQQTFKWYAGRSEIFNWKDVPQDARNLLEWQQRRRELYDPQQRYSLGLLSYTDQQLRDLGKRYGARYLLVPQWQVDLMTEPTRLQQVYPPDPGQRSTYALFRLEDDASTAPAGR